MEKVNMKLQKRFYLIVNTVIRTLLVLIVSGLLLQSMFSTSFIGSVMTQEGGWQEQTRNIADDPLRHIAVFVIFTILVVLDHKVCMRYKARKVSKGYGNYNVKADTILESEVAFQSEVALESEKALQFKVANGQQLNVKKKKDVSDRRIFRILSIFALAIGVLWIMVTQLQPGSDPAKVYEIAMQWREGNFSSYAEGGYLFRYPFQAGIILFYYLLTFVFGVDNYIGLQFVNVIALVAVYVLLSKLAAGFWKDERKLPVLVYAVLILWTPLAFYVTYLYGILPGMALSLGAVYCVARYLDSGKYRYVLPACLCMGLATVIKMNCLIYMIATACFLLYDAIEAVCGSRGNGSSKVSGAQDVSGGREGNSWSDSVSSAVNQDLQNKFSGADREGGFGKKSNVGRAVASLGVIALMGLSVMGCNEAVNRYVERLSGYEAGEGFEMLAWVVMGLQETPLGPGGYSGYIGDIYLRYDYDADKVREAAWTDIRKAMTRMSENPLDEGVTFFARKNAFQWNDPSFISLDRTKRRDSAIEMPEFVSDLIDGHGSVRFYVLMNYFQTLLLAGMLLYLFLNWKSRNLYELMGAVIFLGGYLFHFVWESSASYTIPYFVVMIPYAVKGMTDWVRYVENVPAYMARNRQGLAGKRELIGKFVLPVGGTVAAFVFVILLGRTNLFWKTIALDDGEEARAQFYHEEENRMEETPELPEGYYCLVPYVAQNVRVAEVDGKVTMMSYDAAESESGETLNAIDADVGENSEAAEDVKMVEGTERAEDAEAIEGAKRTEDTKAIEGAEATEDTKAIEDIEAENAKTTVTEVIDVAKKSPVSNIYVPDVEDIEQKILFHMENNTEGNEGAADHSSDIGVILRFRSNEQVMAVEETGASLQLTVYLDDGMNMFYEPKENVSYLWNMYGTPEQGYCIVIDGMALTYRDGAVVLEEVSGEEEQRWILR